MRLLEGKDAISGKEGRGYIKINGNNEELFFAKAIEATIEKAKSDVKTIGRRMAGHKTTGLTGSGSMTVYYLSPMFRQIVAEYKNTGRDLYLDMVIENNDQESAAGRQDVLLTGVNFDSVVLAKLDGDSDDALDEEIAFTFDDFDILTPFSKF